MTTRPHREYGARRRARTCGRTPRPDRSPAARRLAARAAVDAAAFPPCSDRRASRGEPAHASFRRHAPPAARSCQRPGDPLDPGPQHHASNGGAHAPLTPRRRARSPPSVPDDRAPSPLTAARRRESPLARLTPRGCVTAPGSQHQRQPRRAVHAARAPCPTRARRSSPTGLARQPPRPRLDSTARPRRPTARSARCYAQPSPRPQTQHLASRRKQRPHTGDHRVPDTARGRRPSAPTLATTVPTSITRVETTPRTRARPPDGVTRRRPRHPHATQPTPHDDRRRRDPTRADHALPDTARAAARARRRPPGSAQRPLSTTTRAPAPTRRFAATTISIAPVSRALVPYARGPTRHGTRPSAAPRQAGPPAADHDRRRARASRPRPDSGRRSSRDRPGRAVGAA